MILIGHSEGGLILRRAIADVVKDFHQKNEQYRLETRPAPNIDAFSEKVHAEGKAKGWPRGKISAVILRHISMLSGGMPKPSPPPIAAAKLRLFALAIMGARPSRLLGWLDSSLIGSVLRPFFRASVAYNDMSPGSESLTAIRDHTEFYSEHYPDLTALRAAILWGDKEAVVQVGNYRNDARNRFAEGHDHVSVCKPNLAYLLPMEFTRD